MQNFRLRVAWRDTRGIVRVPAHDRMFEAASLREAVGVVLGDADSLLTEGTNLAWLTDRADNLLWTLRMDDQNAEAT